MTIVVCPLSQIPAQVAAHTPDRIVSLLDPGARFPELDYGARHLKLAFHDVEHAEDWEIPPNMEHVRALIAFVRGWSGAAPLLIHCHAGISRSSAAAFIAACALNPDTEETAIAGALRAASAHARPNPALVRLADDALGRSGRMLKGLLTVYDNPGRVPVLENEPFMLASRHGAR